MGDEDFFLDDDDPSTTLQLLSKRRRNDKNSDRSRKKIKLNHNAEEDDDLDKNVDFTYSSDEDNSSSISDDQEDKETTAEKRLRLAQNYLQALANQETTEKINDAKAGISTKLQEEAQETQGRLVKEVAFKLKDSNYDPPKVTRVLRGHKLSPTCVAVSEDGTTAFSGSKDCSVIQWDIETGKKLITRGGRKYNTKTTITGQVLAVAVSSDNKYYATGGRDKLVRIWDTRSNTIIHSFSHHRGAITSLKFRKDSYQLFSGSEDRTVKTWNLDPMMYIETLFGHQSGVMSVDSLYKERAISSGEDRTCRIWKLVEESQLLYRGHTTSIDCLSMINEEVFVSGSQDGSIGVWHAGHKRPNFVFNKAHGPETPWISSICAQPFTDLVVSGSNDGNLNFWQYSKSRQLISRAKSLPIEGFINGIDIPKSGNFVVAAVGQEHRLGRWWRNKKAKNSIQIISIPQ